VAVELGVDPGQLYRTAEREPQLFDAVVRVLKKRTDAQNEAQERFELRRQLNKY